MRLILILLGATLTACSHTHYRNGPVALDRWSIGDDTIVRKLSDNSDKFGNHSVRIGALDNNKSESLKKAVGAAIDAVMEGVP